MEPPARLRVTILDKQKRHRLARAPLRSLLEAAARSLDVEGELTLVLCADDRIRRLNRRYRRKDRPTDVLSFPGPGGAEGIGDVVISVATAARNARLFARSLPEELQVLALHGFLHCLGYDHERDAGEMEALEARLRRELLAQP